MYKKILSILFLAILFNGCAQDVGTIDRTQHDRILKKTFSGIWYYNQTVIDIPYSSAFTFVGEMNFGATGKILWDIQEKYIVAYPVSEWVVGAEKKWVKKQLWKYWDDTCMEPQSEKYNCVETIKNYGKTKCCYIEVYVGQPVAAFEIVSHFDVFRKYNPSTGEQTNVLEENTIDKKWYQRKYIRVNFAKNNINDYTFMARIAKQSPVDYYVQTFEEDNPDVPTISKNYIDIVTKVFVEPASTGSCDIYLVSMGDCAGAVIKIRNSFRKVPPLNDYEPQYYHNTEYMEYFGYFLTERNAYDENFGTTEHGKLSLINRWNIWEKSKVYEYPKDEKGEDVKKACFKDPDDSGCNKKNNEICYAEEWFTYGECMKWKPLPYVKRGIRPIVYFLSAYFPDFLKTKAYEAVENWNKAYKETVAWLYFWEKKGYIYGQTQTKECSTDADCSQHALLDITIPVETAKSIVFLDKLSHHELIDSQFPELGVGEAAVRFLNFTDGKVSLSNNKGEVIFTDTGKIDPKDNNPQYKIIKSGTFDYIAKEGGEEVAKRKNVNIGQKTVSTFIYIGNGKLLRVSETDKFIGGVRIINASEKFPEIDVAINGAKRGKSVKIGGSTGYQPVQKYPQRITVIETGARTDITCYRFEQFGRCVGWKPEITDKDKEEYQKILDNLEDVYVLCDNIYSADRCKEEELGNKAVLNDCRYSKKNKDGSIKNPCKNYVRWVNKIDKNDIEGLEKELNRWKKIGDSRYSFVYWVAEAQAASPLGYGPSAADPDTGEIFWGTANLYGAFVLTYGAYARDLVDLLNGNLPVDSFITGKYVKDYIEKLYKEEKYMNKNSSLSFDEKDANFENNPKDLNNKIESNKNYEFEMLSFLFNKNKMKEILKGKLPINDPIDGAKKMNKIKGTYLEDLLLNNEIKFAFENTDPQQSISPLEWATYDAVRKERERLIFLGKHTYCFSEFDDEAVIGISKELGCTPEEKELKAQGQLDKLCLEGEALMHEVTRRLFGGLAEHEIGHTLGLRHNFEGSSDLFNYFNEYYEIRKKEVQPCTHDQECPIFGVGEKCINNKCRGDVKVEYYCSIHSDCGDANYYQCINGKCYEFTTCNSSANCGEGENCENGYCVDMGGEKIIKQVVNTIKNAPVEKLLPRPHLEDEEKIKKRTEYQYSSVMDYGQRIINADIHGIGKWDVAAIKFGYGQLLEVYRDISNLKEAIKKSATAFQSSEIRESDVLDSSYWGWGVYFSQFYFLNHYIGIKENLKRDTVPYEQVKLEQSMVKNYNREWSDVTYVRVPYKFCGDEYRGNVGCYAWDTGVDILEIIHNNKIMLEEYYLFDAFKRERFGFGFGGSPLGYFSRILTRWMAAMQDAGMYYALFTHLFKGSEWIDLWKNARLYGWPLRKASEMGFDTLAKVIATPSPGSFKLNEDENIYENISFEKGVNGSELNVDITDGKFPYTTFMDDAGYQYFNHILWVGSFWEKLAAIMTLTDSTVYFTTDYVGEQLNIGVSTSIGFNTIYQRELTNLLGGIVAEEYKLFAPYVDDGRIKFRSFFTSDDMSKKSLVKPTLINTNMKLYAALYGISYLPAGFDPSFSDYLALCLKGNGNCYDIAKGSGVDIVEFTEPFGGKTYVAWKPLYDPGERFAVSYEILKKCNKLKKNWEKAEGEEKIKLKKKLKENIEILDLLRALNELYGNMSL